MIGLLSYVRRWLYIKAGALQLELEPALYLCSQWTVTKFMTDMCNEGGLGIEKEIERE